MTYRIQFHKDFTFNNLEEIIEYLNQIGVSTIYASPIFEAREGSNHGYDVVNPLKINPEVGHEEGLYKISHKLRLLNMNWLQDIVPNHMAFHMANGWLYDVLEKGQESRFAKYFDINWDHPDYSLNGKIMVPFLGDQLDKMLRDGEIQLQVLENKLVVKVYENHYPVSPQTYEYIGRALQIVPDGFSFAGDDKWEETKLEFIKSNFDKIEELLVEWNQNPDKLEQVLEMQHYSLQFWKNSQEKINYRRFFTINELICLNMQDKEVFRHYHSYIKKLVHDGVFTGLRIDHLDGLYDPVGYLEKLREETGPETYIVVEKIVEWDEELPEGWPVQGTSGYDFVPIGNHLFTDPSKEEEFNRFYHELLPHASEFEGMVFRKKLFILLNRMGGEWDNLAHLIYDNLPHLELSIEQLRAALAVYLAMFPVYRIYSKELPVPTPELMKLDRAFVKAREQAPELENALDQLRNEFTEMDHDDEETRKRKFYLLRRMQQFTGPLAAKGVEDTSFYIYSRLISHNEVGDSPEKFGISPEAFHDRLTALVQRYPHTMNTTSTHDTKRGEDARMRLNALSEIPNEWENRVKGWMESHSRFVHDNNGEKAPHKREMYFIYQTMLSVFPFGGNADESLLQRLDEYLEKALREAKVNTNWTEPDLEYEKLVKEFTADVLKDEAFINSEFLPLLSTITFFGAIYSLSNVVLKLAAPGVPDIYQGCELWNFSLVDPDNRRPVDYDLRKKHLQELNSRESENLNAYLEELKTNFHDGRIKFFTTVKAMQCRTQNHDLFSFGDYVPMYASGDKTESIVGFARRFKYQTSIVVIPRVLQQYLQEGQWPTGSFWKGNSIELPFEIGSTMINIYDGTKHHITNSIDISEVLNVFPVAILISE